MSANPYAPDDDQQAANDAAVREAVRLIVAAYNAETAGRNLTVRLRQEQDKASRLAYWLARQDEKRDRP